MSSFLQNLEQVGNETRTENNAKAYRSTLDPVLDFFSQAGAKRNDIKGAIQLFAKAYAADKNLALKTLFYLRDVRGGQGERDLFRACFVYLTEEDKNVASKLVQLISEYGRWDDVIHATLGTNIHDEGVELISAQLKNDQESKGQVSLLAKWLPSENASSKLSRTLARDLAKALELKPRAYRKLLSDLRAKIRLLEQKMSTKQWNEIEYDKLPSQAFRKHTKAFSRNDEDRFKNFLGAVKKGEKKVNAKTVYAYEVFNMVQNGNDEAADAVWNNLPDYTKGKNALVVADVSGSMFTYQQPQPVSVSVSLALYFADRNDGPFAGKFLTFSEHPKLQTVRGETLSQKMMSISQAEWGMNTNLYRTFRAVLDAAVESKAKQDEIPGTIYIISDMQFDSCTHDNSETNFERAEREFREAGYELPHLVFWNVNAYKDNTPATKFDNRVTLISGLSQSTFRYAVEGKTPLQSMLDILGSERYAAVSV